ncbi:MAG TPA: hypothetical protein PK733_10325 [Clostridiales bacterium]|nr:hypothetical protein [Clostridiales bacterium]
MEEGGGYGGRRRIWRKEVDMNEEGGYGGGRQIRRKEVGMKI